MPRSIRFRYNPVFLPEYLSTVLISLPISAIFMTTPMGGGPRAFIANPHLGVAIGLYISIAFWLLGMTIFYRRRYCPVVFFCGGPDQIWIDAGRGRVPLPNISEVEQTLESFFGRTVRSVSVEDDRGTRIRLCDAIFEFDSSKSLLRELVGQDIIRSYHADPQQIERVRSLWFERHRMFPASETLGDVFSRLSWRGVCLLPVAVVDVLINIFCILSLSKFQKHQLMVYSAPLSLVVSGFIARYVYYYMFTSTTMNKPLGSKPK